MAECCGQYYRTVGVRPSPNYTYLIQKQKQSFEFSHMTTAKTAASPDSRLITQIVAGTLARTVLNTSRRFIYPFAPVISRGLGVPITSVSTLLAVNQVAGLASPFFGPVSDRMGYRFTMLLGLGLVGGAMLASGLFPIYAVLLIALFFAGMGRGIYDPALQAFAGQNVPYAYRGRVIGLIEMSWSASSLIGIPLVGLLIARLGWRSPFLVLGMACLGLMLLMGALIPAHAGRNPPAHAGHKLEVGLAGDMLQRWQQLFHTPRAVGMLLFAFAINMANDVLFVVYGVWLEESFGLTVVALGVTTMVIGVAELGGEGLTVLLADRIGLGRAVTGSLALSALAYALFPYFASSLNTALAGLFVVFLIFEFNIVCAISLFTEVLPDARATMMSGYKAAAGLGRVFGALMGIPILLATGMAGVGLTAGVICLLGLAALVWALRRWREDERAGLALAGK